MAERRCRICDRALPYVRGWVCRRAECQNANAARESAEMLRRRKALLEERRANRRVEQRKQFSRYERWKFHQENGWICYLCSEPTDRVMERGAPDAPVIDHKVPLSRGGTNDRENLGTAHHKCNVAKWTKTPDEFFAQRDV